MEKNSKTVRIRANAKINLTLEVLGKRADGYHELRTVMHSVGIYDQLTLEALPPAEHGVSGRITVCSSVPLPENNTACRAAQAYFSANDAGGCGVRIEIEKGIPSEAGLGGASADAAAVLRGMELLFGRLDEKTLYSLGKSVGADVPFCLHGGCALCEGIGEKLTDLTPQALDLVIVRGERGVSTAALFRSLDENDHGKKPNRSAPAVELLRCTKRGDAASRLAPLLMNDLAPAAELVAPEIGLYRQLMLECGALGAVMTGSGACVFGIFDSARSAARAFEAFSDCAFRAVCTTADVPLTLLASGLEPADS